MCHSEPSQREDQDHGEQWEEGPVQPGMQVSDKGDFRGR